MTNMASKSHDEDLARETHEKNDHDDILEPPTRWSMGVLNDKYTNQVPGSVLLLTGARNEPLGLQNAPGRTSHSSLPVQTPLVSRRSSRQSRAAEGKKLTKDGQIILEPQPDDSHNDPLNWPGWKRDIALLSLGIYCMVGGGMTPILAAGFTNVAATYHTTTVKVALTTGLFMMGMGIGSVFASPTAILFGKRPVYLAGALMFVATSVWCAASPSYNSLLIARIFQGIAISPVECLPSATIAEIFFLHERAFRIGIYTLLLLGGKNLVPLVSAAIIQGLSWQWVFWIVAMVGGFCWFLLFFFVPETFWDRTPVPKSRKSSTVSHSHIPALFRRKSSTAALAKQVDGPSLEKTTASSTSADTPPQRNSGLHVGFAPDVKAADESVDQHGSQVVNDATDIRTVDGNGDESSNQVPSQRQGPTRPAIATEHLNSPSDTSTSTVRPNTRPFSMAMPAAEHTTKPGEQRMVPPTPWLHTINSPFYQDVQRRQSGFFGIEQTIQEDEPRFTYSNLTPVIDKTPVPVDEERKISIPPATGRVTANAYTADRIEGPRVRFAQQLKPFNGRLNRDSWIRVAARPFILYSYPAVLWSSVVYACSVGWLIVLSESVSVIFRTKQTYGFSALSAGLVYLAPFIGGVLGTAVAGKVSDIIVKTMARRNGGLYEPEFRLVMVIPIAISTVIGLMGFGWSAYDHDKWIVPTVFFGIISFGCALGSTTAITFCVDSYRQYAGEALVTLNFTKNIFHGLVFSLFFPKWLESKGSKSVFIWLGVIQLVVLTSTIPMFLFGKRARMWTVRQNLMERF